MNLFDSIIDCIDRDDVECLKKFVKTKKDVNLEGPTTSGYLSPLWYATTKGAKKSAEFLINKGADVNYRPYGHEPSALATLIFTGWIDLAQKIVDSKLPITKTTFVGSLHEALGQQDAKQIEQITYLIDSLVKHVVGPDGKLTQYLRPTVITDLLTTSVSHSNLEVFKHFINTYDIDVRNFADKEGNSILHLAVTSINLDKVKYLVEEKGISVNVVNKKLETPLHTVHSELASFDIMNERYIEKLAPLSSISKYLISKGADLEVRSSKRETPIDLLIQSIEQVPDQVTSRYLDHVIVGVRTIADVLRHSIQQGKLSREKLDKYVADVYKAVTNKKIEKYKKLQYEILTLPIKSLLPNFLKKRLTELCEGGRHVQHV